LLVTHVCKREGYSISHLLMHLVRDTNTPGFGDSLQPSRDIDPVAVETFTFVNYVSGIYPNPEEHGGFALGVKLRHASLYGGGAFHSTHGTRKLGENAIARQINYSAAELLNNG